MPGGGPSSGDSVRDTNDGSPARFRRSDLAWEMRVDAHSMETKGRAHFSRRRVPEPLTLCGISVRGRELARSAGKGGRDR